MDSVDPLTRGEPSAGIFEDKVAMRKDAATFLGSRSPAKDYAVIQHDEGFKSINAIMRTADGAHYETAERLGRWRTSLGFSRSGIYGQSRETMFKKGYLLFSTGHDGSMAHSYRLCMTRVVCARILSGWLCLKRRKQT